MSYNVSLIFPGARHNLKKPYSCMMYGRKHILVASMVLFTVATVLCIVAPTLPLCRRLSAYGAA